MDLNMTFLIIMGIQVGTGALLTIFVKYQDKQMVNGVFFQHAYIQTMISFIGQTINFLLYYLQTKFQREYLESERKKAIEKNKIIKLPIKLLLIPAMFHCLCMIAGMSAYFYMQASVSMMLGSSLPVVTMILARILFKRSAEFHEYIGMAIIIAGSIVLGFFAIYNQDAESTSNAWLGLILSISSLIFFGFLMISEEYLLKNYYIEGTIIAGTEGFCALILSIVVFPLLNLVKKDFVDFPLFYNQVLASWPLIIGCFGILFSDMAYTLLCILLIKHSNSLIRSIIYQLRIILVWILALILYNPPYFAQKHWEKFSFWQLTGYLLLLLGVLQSIKVINLSKYIKREEVGQEQAETSSQAKELDFTEASKEPMLKQHQDEY